MIRAAMTALLAMTMAMAMAGCGSDGPAANTNTPRQVKCDAGEVAVDQPVPALPKCEPADGGADDASAPAAQ